MLVIYGSDLSSPANKVRYVANLLNLDYEYKVVKLRDGEQFSAEYKKINPVSKIPAIDDGGFCLSESNAICRYLCDKQNSEYYPKDLKKRAVVDQWIDFATMHVGAAVSKVIYNRVFAPLRKEPVDQNSINEGLKFLGRFLPIVEEQLVKNDYITGSDLTLADIVLLASLDPCEVSGIDIVQYPKLIQWRNKLRSRDFYQKCFKEYGESLKTAAR